LNAPTPFFVSKHFFSLLNRRDECNVAAMSSGVRLMPIIAGFILSNARLLASTNAVEGGPITLSPEEREWITRHPVMRVGALTNWAPFSYLDPAGSLSGIDIDLLNIISRRTGLRFEQIPYGSWEALVTNWDQLDVVCSVGKSPLREQVAVFTKDYTIAPLVIVEREGEETFGTAAVLGSKKLALPRRHLTTQIVTNRLPSAQVIFTATQQESFELVARKKADATIANLFIASQYLNSHPKIKLAISGVLVNSSIFLRMAVNRDLDERLPVSILDKGLASISQGELDHIVSKHLLFGLESRERVGLIQKRAEQVLIAATVAGLLLTLWNFFMRKEIRARRKAEAELREANESTQIFAHSLSHDLRAPLRGITGFAHLLKKDIYEKLDREGQAYLERIMTSGSQMNKMIDDVLAYSQASNSQWPMETVELEPLVRHLIERFSPQQRQCLHIVSKLPAVRGNATLLTQCLGNLLSNALSYVPRERMPRVIIRVTQGDCGVTVFVEDNGIGVEPNDRKRIFQIFERAAPADYEGTGIGLAVVAKAAERMGGSVGVESEVGQGSQFWIRLPGADSQSPRRQSHPFWRRFVLLRGT
jgi:signal transduction histidine kinase